MADKINFYENKEKSPTATIAVCWNSSPLPGELQRIFHGLLNRKLSQSVCYIDFKSRLRSYYKKAISTAKVGELLAKIVTVIQQEFPNIKYVHGIGHSLGAHVMGNIFNFGGVKLNRYM